MIDVAALLADFEPAGIVWEVYPAATVNAFGETVIGTATLVEDATAVAHPATRRQLARMLDGADHAVEPLAIYTTAEVYAGGGSSAPTHARYQGRRYEVATVGDYQREGGVTLVLASLVDDSHPP